MSQQQLKEPLGNSEVPVKTCLVGGEARGGGGVGVNGGQKAKTSLPTHDRCLEIRLIRAGFTHHAQAKVRATRSTHVQPVVFQTRFLSEAGEAFAVLNNLLGERLPSYLMCYFSKQPVLQNLWRTQQDQTACTCHPEPKGGGGHDTLI